MTREIELTRGYVALVDDDDFEWASKFSWWASVQVNKYGLRVDAKRTIQLEPGTRRTSTVFLSRQIMNAQRGDEVDHINGNPLDCRKGNLRLADKHQNKWNVAKRCTNKTGFKGIRLHKKVGRWGATLKCGGKLYWLGMYGTAEEAARAYDAKARELHGDFARLNFPLEGERSA